MTESKLVPPPISIVIRTYNEEQRMRALLNMLFEQTVSNLEVIIIDNCSTDATLDIISDFPISKLASIPRNRFSHPFSTNVGVYLATSNYVALFNGHCTPISEHWVEAGLEHFHDPNVCAVDGSYRAYPDGTLWEKLGGWRQIALLSKPMYNLPISTTNVVIRKDLWREYQFDETLPECEDYDWGREMQARGYVTIRDPRLNVYHSHEHSLRFMLQRGKKWKNLRAMLDARARPRSSRSVVFQKSLAELGISLGEFGNIA